MIQLKDFVKLVAWKSSQAEARDKLIAAECDGKDFDRLLRLFVAGTAVRHDDLHVMSFTSECCMMMRMLMTTMGDFNFR